MKLWQSPDFIRLKMGRMKSSSQRSQFMRSQHGKPENSQHFRRKLWVGKAPRRKRNCKWNCRGRNCRKLVLCCFFSSNGIEKPGSAPFFRDNKIHNKNVWFSVPSKLFCNYIFGNWLEQFHLNFWIWYERHWWVGKRFKHSSIVYGEVLNLDLIE